MTGDLPVWVQPSDYGPDNPVIREALDLGAVGVWLGNGLFAQANPVAIAQRFRALVHDSTTAPV
jgi:DhnA family fructose-bisphosphate aldolase class Ia